MKPGASKRLDASPHDSSAHSTKVLPTSSFRTQNTKVKKCYLTATSELLYISARPRADRRT